MTDTATTPVDESSNCVLLPTECVVGLNTLSLPNYGITSLEGLNAQSQLECLYLKDNLIKNFEGLGVQPTLKELHLQNNHIKNFRAMVKQPKLEAISLEGNPITKHQHLRVMAILACGPQLQRVDNVPLTQREHDLARKLGSGASPAVALGWVLDMKKRTDAEWHQLIEEVRTRPRSVASSRRGTPSPTPSQRSAKSHRKREAHSRHASTSSTPTPVHMEPRAPTLNLSTVSNNNNNGDVERESNHTSNIPETEAGGPAPSTLPPPHLPSHSPPPPTTNSASSSPPHSARSVSPRLDNNKGEEGGERQHPLPHSITTPHSSRPTTPTLHPQHDSKGPPPKPDREKKRNHQKSPPSQNADFTIPHQDAQNGTTSTRKRWQDSPSPEETVNGIISNSGNIKPHHQVASAPGKAYRTTPPGLTPRTSPLHEHPPHPQQPQVTHSNNDFQPNRRNSPNNNNNSNVDTEHTTHNRPTTARIKERKQREPPFSQTRGKQQSYRTQQQSAQSHQPQTDQPRTTAKQPPVHRRDHIQQQQQQDGHHMHNEHVMPIRPRNNSNSSTSVQPPSSNGQPTIPTSTPTPAPATNSQQSSPAQYSLSSNAADIIGQLQATVAQLQKKNEDVASSLAKERERNTSLMKERQLVTDQGNSGLSMDEIQSLECLSFCGGFKVTSNINFSNITNSINTNRPSSPRNHHRTGVTPTATQSLIAAVEQFKLDTAYVTLDSTHLTFSKLFNRAKVAEVPYSDITECKLDDSKGHVFCKTRGGGWVEIFVEDGCKRATLYKTIHFRKDTIPTLHRRHYHHTKRVKPKDKDASSVAPLDDSDQDDFNNSKKQRPAAFRHNSADSTSSDSDNGSPLVHRRKKVTPVPKLDKDKVDINPPIPHTTEPSSIPTPSSTASTNERKKSVDKTLEKKNSVGQLNSSSVEGTTEGKPTTEDSSDDSAGDKAAQPSGSSAPPDLASESGKQQSNTSMLSKKSISESALLDTSSSSSSDEDTETKGTTSNAVTPRPSNSTIDVNDGNDKPLTPRNKIANMSSTIMTPRSNPTGTSSSESSDDETSVVSRSEKKEDPSSDPQVANQQAKLRGRSATSATSGGTTTSESDSDDDTTARVGVDSTLGSPPAPKPTDAPQTKIQSVLAKFGLDKDGDVSSNSSSSDDDEGDDSDDEDKKKRPSGSTTVPQPQPIPDKQSNLLTADPGDDVPATVCTVTTATVALRKNTKSDDSSSDSSDSDSDDSEKDERQQQLLPQTPPPPQQGPPSDPSTTVQVVPTNTTQQQTTQMQTQQYLATPPPGTPPPVGQQSMMNTQSPQQQQGMHPQQSGSVSRVQVAGSGVQVAGSGVQVAGSGSVQRQQMIQAGYGYSAQQQQAQYGQSPARQAYPPHMQQHQQHMHVGGSVQQQRPGSVQQHTYQHAQQQHTQQQYMHQHQHQHQQQQPGAGSAVASASGSVVQGQQPQLLSNPSPVPPSTTSSTVPGGKKGKSTFGKMMKSMGFKNK